MLVCLRLYDRRTDERTIERTDKRLNSVTIIDYYYSIIIERLIIQVGYERLSVPLMSIRLHATQLSVEMGRCIDINDICLCIVSYHQTKCQRFRYIAVSFVASDLFVILCLLEMTCSVLTPGQLSLLSLRGR